MTLFMVRTLAWLPICLKENFVLPTHSLLHPTFASTGIFSSSCGPMGSTKGFRGHRSQVQTPVSVMLLIFIWPNGQKKMVPKPQVAGSNPRLGYIFPLYMAQWIEQNGFETRGRVFGPVCRLYIVLTFYAGNYEKSACFRKILYRRSKFAWR